MEREVILDLPVHRVYQERMVKQELKAPLDLVDQQVKGENQEQ